MEGRTTLTKEKRGRFCWQVGFSKNYTSKYVGSSRVVQWLGLQAFIAKGMGSIPGRGTEIL